jgi:hypothetical protein
MEFNQKDRPALKGGNEAEKGSSRSSQLEHYDSDDLSGGNFWFKMAVTGAFPDFAETFNTTLDSGTTLEVIPANMKFDSGLMAVSDDEWDVKVSISAVDDDSGSVPSDDDDSALCNFGNIDIPWGVSEKVDHRKVWSTSVYLAGDNDLKCTPTINYTVSYEP